MKRRALLQLLLGALLSGLATPAQAQQGPFLSGSVIWHSGPPAHGLEVRLLRGNQAVTAAFTDQEGFFAFYGIAGQPNEYRIVVVSARGVLADQPVPPIPPGGRIPPIVLR
jgi:hypothetical protein